MNTGVAAAPSGAGLTAGLIAQVRAIDAATLPPDVRRLASQCILDTLGVMLAARDEPVVRLITQMTREDGGAAQASVFGAGLRTSAAQAALCNGTLAHALDFDDVNLNINGHPSAVLLPALLALGEAVDASGADLLLAYVAGHEFACRAGAVVQPDHYARGFHSTSTVGALGAAIACARLLGLDAQACARAVGIAATRASGLKAMFGTDCKAYHAGLAAEDGVRAALLASRGMSSRQDVIECRQGFAATQSQDFHPARALEPARWFIRDNLFKYHAACYGTHSTIECAQSLRAAHRLDPAAVERVLIQVERGSDSTCNIARPASSHEAKFSLRFTSALALCGADTGALDSYGQTRLDDARIRQLIERTEVELVDCWPTMHTRMSVTASGETFTTEYDSGVPIADLDLQERKLSAKFSALAGQALGAAPAAQLADAVHSIEQVRVRELIALCVGDGR